MFVVNLRQVFIHNRFRIRNFELGLCIAALDCHDDNGVFFIARRISNAAGLVFEFFVPFAECAAELVVDFVAQIICGAA